MIKTYKYQKQMFLKKESPLKPGKLADLIVMDKNPLEDIKNSNSVIYTMINRRLYDVNTMNEIGNYDNKRTQQL